MLVVLNCRNNGRGPSGAVDHSTTYNIMADNIILRSDFNYDPPRNVAIKLMNVDDVDYQANGMEKDETLKDIKNEINILMQLKDSRARNVNLIYEVLEVDGQLWIVCEHCPGGSLRTVVSPGLLMPFAYVLSLQRNSPIPTI